MECRVIRGIWEYVNWNTTYGLDYHMYFKPVLLCRISLTHFVCFVQALRTFVSCTVLWKQRVLSPLLEPLVIQKLTLNYFTPKLSQFNPKMYNLTQKCTPQALRDAR